MNADRRQSTQLLNRFLEELGGPLPAMDHMRVRETLELQVLSNEPAAEYPTRSHSLPGFHWLPVAAVVALLFAAVLLIGTLSLPGNAQTIAQRSNGKAIRAGQVVRAESSGDAVLALRDGSRVEMDSSAELSINEASDGIQIDLANGNVIVTAAKQHRGHLYVKTRDCMVSVVGTVFSVKAEAAGSRVAVIEGEVHVQHGDVFETLLPGQQVSTSAALKEIPLQSEIGWSQDAAAHIAMLQQTTAPPAVPPAAAPVNPDMLGEIRMILAPVDQLDPGRPVLRNNTFISQLIEGQQNGLMDPARAGIFRFFDRGVPPNGFSFSITGVQGRSFSFASDKGETFSYGCAECSFFVSGNGVTTAAPAADASVEFKLSGDGTQVTVTCHATRCARFQQNSNDTQASLRPDIRYRIAAGGDSASTQTSIIPVSILIPQTDNRTTVFIVIK